MISDIERAQCVRELGFLEQYLAEHASDTHNWVLRSEIYAHLYTNTLDSQYTAEQLYFGPYVAGLSPEATRKAAFSYSFLSQPAYKKYRDIAQDLDNDADI